MFFAHLYQTDLLIFKKSNKLGKIRSKIWIQHAICFEFLKNECLIKFFFQKWSYNLESSLNFT